MGLSNTWYLFITLRPLLPVNASGGTINLLNIFANGVSEMKNYKIKKKSPFIFYT